MLDMQLFDGETQTKNHRNKKSSEISKVGGMIGTWFKGQLLTPNIKKVTVLRRNKKKLDFFLFSLQLWARDL